MRAHRCEHLGRIALPAQHLLPSVRMGPHDGPLLVVEAPGFVEDREGDPGFSDVVQECRLRHALAIGAAKAELFGKPRRQTCNEQTMLMGGIVELPDDIEPRAHVRLAEH